jgi:SWI/SNF-related matrix-associated actin-dependent regulator 1 of chromatin subfamily A
MLITLQAKGGGHHYIVRFDRYRKQVIDKLKAQVPGRRWDAKENAWIIPASNIARESLEQLTYYVRHFEPVQWGDVQPQTQEEEKTYDLPELPALDRDHGLKIQPYPYQLEGIARGLQLKRFINGDDMGLGKTLQAIATVNLAGAYPPLPGNLSQRRQNKLAARVAQIHRPARLHPHRQHPRHMALLLENRHEPDLHRQLRKFEKILCQTH